MTVRNLDRLLAPAAVALIGASDREGSLGRVVLQRLRSGGFHGRLDLVNPRWRSIDGLDCVGSVADLAHTPDLGVIVTPAATVPGLIADLGQAGARAAVVIMSRISAHGTSEVIS